MVTRKSCNPPYYPLYLGEMLNCGHLHMIFFLTIEDNTSAGSWGEGGVPFQEMTVRLGRDKAWERKGESGKHT